MTNKERLNDVGFCGPEERSLGGREAVCHNTVVDGQGLIARGGTIWLALQQEMKWALEKPILL